MSAYGVPFSVVDNPDQLDVRVILVGTTGLDAALRLDPGIELVRVRTPLEAIGELSSPIDDHSPERAVVVVASDVEKSLGDQDPTTGGPAAGNGVTGGGSARIGDFVRGLRLVSPNVVVLGMGRGGIKPPPAYDATIAQDLPAETLRRVVRGVFVEPGRGPTDSPRGESRAVSPESQRAVPDNPSMGAETPSTPSRAFLRSTEASPDPVEAMLSSIQSGDQSAPSSTRAHADLQADLNTEQRDQGCLLYTSPSPRD